MRNKLRYLFVALCGFGWAASAAAQTTVLENKALRTDTWSIYAQGGVSKAFGIEYQDVRPQWITELSPEWGAGINYHLRPWLRLGLNYEFSNFSRQQQYDEFQPIAAPKDLEGMIILNSYGGLAYSDLTYYFHNTHLSLEFNLMELWKERRSRRFNLYLGSGLGMMFAQGRSYSVEMGSYDWADPANIQDGAEVSDNWATESYVRANNVNGAFNALYVPGTLSFEYDLKPQFTLGLKGEYKYVFPGHHLYQPSGLATAALVLRYNFVGAKPAVSRSRDKYSEMVVVNQGLESMGRVAVRHFDENKAEIGRMEAENRMLEARNKAMEQSLSDSRNEKGLTVFFDVNQAKVSQEDQLRLAELARKVLRGGRKLTLIAEASSDGSSDHNMKLSERRLASVLDVLQVNGLSEEHIEMAKAIGEENQVPGPEQRKVEVYIKNLL